MYQNINFYYDSHDIEKIPPKNVSAITEYGETQGLFHFEHLFISGFSGIGIEIPYYSTGNDIIVSSCGLGMRLERSQCFLVARFTNVKMEWRLLLVLA